jgi:hypothetical protein
MKIKNYYKLATNKCKRLMLNCLVALSTFLCFTTEGGVNIIFNNGKTSVKKVGTENDTLQDEDIPDSLCAITQATIYNFLTITDANVEVTGFLLIICNDDKSKAGAIEINGKGKLVNYGHVGIETFTPSIAFSLKISENAQFINEKKSEITLKSPKTKSKEISGDGEKGFSGLSQNAQGKTAQLINHGTIEFTNKPLSKIIFGAETEEDGSKVKVSSLVLSPEEAAIVNYGIISAEHANSHIDIGIETYIGQQGIIKVKQGERIFIQYKNQYAGTGKHGWSYFECEYDQHPIYAITRIPEKLISQHIDELFGEGDLGEHPTKDYYKRFENIEEDNICSYKEGDGNGIDVICIRNDDSIILHESKCSVKKSFALEENQMSWGWIKGHVQGMRKRCEKLKKLPKVSKALDNLHKQELEKEFKQKKIYQIAVDAFKSKNSEIEQLEADIDGFSGNESDKEEIQEQKEELKALNEDELKGKLLRLGSSVYFIHEDAFNQRPTYYLQRVLKNITEEPIPPKEKKSEKNKGKDTTGKKGEK